MRKLLVIVFALPLLLGLECGDNEPPPTPLCDELDECRDLDLFCTGDGLCNCPGVGECRRVTVTP